MRRTRKVKRWVAVLLLAAILILVMSSVVMAATNDPASQPNGLLNNQKITSYYQANKPNYGEQFIAGILIGTVKWIMNLFNLSDPVLLVFHPNNLPQADTSNTLLNGGLYGPNSGNYVLGLFPKPFFDAVSVLYIGFQKLLPLPLVMALIIIAILHMLNAGTAEGRAKLKENVRFVLIAMLTVRFGAYIWTGIVELNNFLVNLIWAYMMQAGVKPGFFMDMIWGAGQQGFSAATQMLGIPMVILLILAAMMVLALNYQYTLRFIILGLLILIFPLACALSIFPGYRHSLPMWLKEFVANVILQLAHALALGAFFITIYATGGVNGSISFWLMITYFAGLPALAGLIRELLGLRPGGGSRTLAGIGAVAGFASAGALGKMLMKNPASKAGADGQTFGNSGTGDGLTNGLTGSGLASIPGSAAKISGATSTMGRVAQGAYNGLSSVARGANAVTGNAAVRGAAKVGIGAAAAVTGGVLSSVTTGSAAPGAALGMGLGSAASRHGARITGSVAGSVGGHIKTAAQTISAGGSIKDAGHAIGQNMIRSSMEKGGMLASAGLGFQSAVNKAAALTGQGESYTAPGFFRENREMFHAARDGMNEIKPQMDLAQAKYEHSLSHFGPKDQKTKDLHEQYQGLKGMYETHAADATLAQMKMRSYHALKQYADGKNLTRSDGTSTYSSGRGAA